MESKTDFILAHPELSAAELVDAAKREGLTVSVSYVYRIRYAARDKRDKDSTFLRLAFEIGLERAYEMLRKIREGLR